MAKIKWAKIGLWVVGVGGLVQVLQPLGFNILNWFGNFSTWVQLGVGAVTIWYAGYRLFWK